MMSNLLTLMNNERLGKVVIDELRLCFNAEPEFIEVLSSLAIGERVHFNKFSVIRTIGQHFKHYFTLFDEDKESVAVIYFGRYGDIPSRFQQHHQVSPGNRQQEELCHHNKKDVSR